MQYLEETVWLFLSHELLHAYEDYNRLLNNSKETIYGIVNNTYGKLYNEYDRLKKTNK